MIASHTPKTIVPRVPAMTMAVATRESVMNDVTRAVLAVRQSDAIWIEKITSAPTRAKAARR